MDTMIWAVVKMILALGMVCTLLVFLVRLLKRNGLARKDFPANSGVRLLTTQLIAPQKYISLVEIGEEILALGISEAQITLLAKIENKEFVARMVDRSSARSDAFSLSQFFSALPLKSKGPKKWLLWRFNGR
jgi:flagellar biogenesis protein FliO